MPLIEWKDTFSVQVRELDMQHRKLVEMLNDLYAAHERGDEQETIGSILRGLAAYTRVHFATEERMLARAGYPNLDTHQAEHAAFTRRIGEFLRAFAIGQADLTTEVMAFMSDWLVDHILERDRAYSELLASKTPV